MEIWYKELDTRLEDYRKESSEKVMRTSPTNLQSKVALKGNDY